MAFDEIAIGEIALIESDFGESTFGESAFPEWYSFGELPFDEIKFGKIYGIQRNVIQRIDFLRISIRQKGNRLIDIRPNGIRQDFYFFVALLLFLS